MKLYLDRRRTSGGATIGELTSGGKLLCYTLEDAIREVSGVPVGHWKVKGSTAIPAGEYPVTLEDSPRFGPDTLTVNDVPGFAFIRMHAGNTTDDTEGCPLLGLRVSGTAIVGGTSRPAVELVRGLVRAAIDRGEHVLLIINNPPALEA